MALDTRARFLDTAEQLFAERGFYGVSIANIAEQLGLTKQALLHHFGNKEKLYGEVLKRISDDYIHDLNTICASINDPSAQLGAYLRHLAHSALDSRQRSQLLLRELLDNKARAKAAGTWYLRPYLNALITMTQAVPKWQSLSDTEALALVYQFLGAITYFAISKPTLTGIFGEETYRHIEADFPDQLDALFAALLERPLS